MRTDGRPQYWSVKALADYFGVAVPTIWRWTSQGYLDKPVKLSPGCTRWPDEAIRRFEEAASRDDAA